MQSLMQLSYRGVRYDATSPVSTDRPANVGEGLEEYRGSYRGVTYQRPYPHPVAVPQPSLNLTYRGVAYTTHTGAPTEASTETPTPVAQPTAQRVSVPTLGRRAKQWREVAAVHQNNIRSLAERRLVSAQSRGDLDLIQAIQAELDYVSR